MDERELSSKELRDVDSIMQAHFAAADIILLVLTPKYFQTHRTLQVGLAVQQSWQEVETCEKVGRKAHCEKLWGWGCSQPQLWGSSCAAAAMPSIMAGTDQVVEVLLSAADERMPSGHM